MSSPAGVIAAGPAAAATPPGQAREFARAFASNRGALIAFVVFALVVFGALFAPIVAVHDPVQQWRDLLDLGGDDRRDAAARLREAILDHSIRFPV